MRPGIVLRWARSPTGLALLTFLLTYLFAIRYCSSTFTLDPTSAFFDPLQGYERHYSLSRQDVADAYIHSSNDSTFQEVDPNNVKMCIGIATVAREGEQYVRSTIGSLLEGLTPEERDEIWIMVLIAHTAPDVHPIYGEMWLTNVVDKVLLYDVEETQRTDLEAWEKEKNFRKKAIFDYTYVLQRCQNTGAQWITMVEDDTLAVAGWYPKTMQALQSADEQHSPGQELDWLYLRLFFTEEFLGWNSEEWVRYVAGSVGVCGMVAMVLLLVRQFGCEATVTNTAIAVACLVCTPACILLYFLAGRLSMQPLTPGVYEMLDFGCCAQGFVFSNRMAPKVIARLAQVREGFVDEIIEAWANELGLVRWVVVPSLLQHIGGHSSKGDDFGTKSKYDRSVAEKIWSFGFEMYEDENT